jgi:thiol-disulfide isomerase/thioredoxin
MRCAMPLADPPARTQINGDKLVVINFGAQWCGPCKTLSPKYQELSRELPSVAFYEVDVDEAIEISREFGIRSVRGVCLVEMVPKG